jgi:hypothetical protein
MVARARAANRSEVVSHQRKMAKTSDRAAPIDVVRDGGKVDRKHPRAPSRMHAVPDADARLMQEVSEDLRAALVPDRIAEAVTRQVETAVSQRVHVLLGQHLTNDLRALLRKHARRGFVEADPSDVLNDALADAVAEGTKETLIEQFSTALRERLPVAIRAATARSAFAQRVGGPGVDDLADRLSAIAEGTIRHHLVAALRSVIRGRLHEVARDDARDILRVGVSPEDGDMSSADQIASLVEGIERAAHERVARGIVDRFRALVSSSLHHATGERLGDGLHRTLAGPTDVVGAPKATDRARPRVSLDQLGERLEGPLTESIRARLMDGLRERVETTCRDNIEDVLRERLLGAIRVAVAEQRGADHVDVGRLAEVVTYELAEVLRARICDGIRARTSEAVRTTLADAIRAGVAQASVV